MELSQFIALGAFLVALIGLVVSIINNLSKSNSEQAKETSESLRLLTEIKTTQDFLGNDMKDMKADLRTYQRDLAEVRQTANTALAAANSANDRLDTIGVPTPHYFSQNGGGKNEF